MREDYKESVLARAANESELLEAARSSAPADVDVVPVYKKGRLTAIRVRRKMEKPGRGEGGSTPLT